MAGEPLEAELVLDTAGALASIETVKGALDDAVSSAGDISIGGDSGGTTAAASSIRDVGNAASEASGPTRSLEDNMKGVEGAALLATGEVGGMRTVVQGFGAAAIPAVAGSLALAGGIGQIAQKGIAGAAATQRFNTIVGHMADQVKKVQVGNLNTDLDSLALKLGTVPSKLENSNASLFQFAKNAGSSDQAAAKFANNITALAARSVALNPALGDVSDVADQMSVRLARGGIFASRLGVSLSAAEVNARALGDTGKTTATDLTTYEKSAAAAEIATERYGSSLDQTITKGSKNAAIEQKRFSATLDDVLEKIGKPLVAPLFSLIEKSLPAVEALGQILATLGVAVLPTVASAAGAVAVPLTALADVITFLRPIIAPLIDAWLAYVAVTKLILPASALAMDGFQLLQAGATGVFADVTNMSEAEILGTTTTADLGITATTAGEQIALFGTEAAGTVEQLSLLDGAAAGATGALGALGAESVVAGEGMAGLGVAGEEAAAGGGLAGAGLGRAAAGATIAAIGFTQIGKSTTGTVTGLLGMAAGGALVGSAFGPMGTVIGGATGLVVGLGKAMFSGGESVDEYRKKFTDLASTIDAASAKVAASSFIDKLGDTDKIGLFTGNVHAATDEIQALATASPAAGQKIYQAFLTGAAGVALTGAQLDALREAEAKGESAFAKTNQEKSKSASIDQQVASGAAGATGAIKAQTAAVESNAKAWSDSTQAVLAQISADLTLQDALAKIPDDITNYNKALQQYGFFSAQASAADRQFLTDALAASKAAGDKAVADAGGAAAAGAAAAGTQAQIQQLISLAGTLSPSSPLRQQLIQYVAKLEEIPADKATTITLDAEQAILQAQGLASALGDVVTQATQAGVSLGHIPGATTGFFTSGGGAPAAKGGKPGAAEGGKVYPGITYAVGERGRPELFTPSVAGTITPTFGSALPSGGTGNLIQMTMQFIVQGHVYGDSHLQEIVGAAFDAHGNEVERAIAAGTR